MTDALAPHEAAPPNWRSGIVAESALLQELLSTIERLGHATLPVILLGETGTGKEVLARAIHRRSGRSGAYVAINCAAIPASLAESELFGHVKGAFTGATGDRRGLFLEADKGTILLDEVGELDIAIQGKLLRALEERQVRPVGTNRLVSVDIRLIAATNRDLRQMVDAGRFREDLYYRLAGIELLVPPLRDRPLDLAALLARFLTEASVGRERPTLAPGTIEELQTRHWRGNIRELRQAVARAVVLGGATLTPRDFPVLRSVREPADVLEGWLKGKRWKEIERAILSYSLARYGTVRATALALAIPKSTLAERVQQLQLTGLTQRLLRPSAPERVIHSLAAPPPQREALLTKGGDIPHDQLDQLCRDSRARLA